MKNESIHPQNITVVNIYDHITASKYIKTTLTYLKVEKNSSTVIRDSNTPISTTDKSSRQLIRNNGLGLYYTLVQWT